MTKKLIILFILITCSVLVLAMNKNNVTVGLNSDSITNQEEDYASYSSNDFTKGLVALGKGTSSSYSEQQLEVASDYYNNEFYIVFSSSNNSIKKHIAEVRDNKFMEHSFADQTLSKPDIINYFLRLEYDNVNLTNRIRWGSGIFDIFIENTGTSKNPKIRMEVVG